MIADDEIVTGPELAKLLGITPTTVSKLGGDGVLVRCGRGRYRLGPSIRGYCESHRAATAQRDSPSSIARAELLTIQAERAKFQHEVERGLWLKRSEVIQEVCAQYRFVRSGVLAAKSRLGNRLPHLSRTDLVEIDDELRACLTEIGTTKWAEVDDDRNDETALETGGSHGAPRDAQHASGRTRRRSRG